MALRNIINHCGHKLKPYRQFSSSTIISKNMYKSSLPILSTPWLMLPPGVRDGSNGPTYNYFNIIDKSIFKIDRSIAYGSVPVNTKCTGSTKGWVAFSYDDSNDSLFLANPYSTEASARKLPLPYGTYEERLHFTLVGDLSSNNFSILKCGKQCSIIANSVIANRNNGYEGLSSLCRPGYDGICRLAYSWKANTVYELHLDNSGKLKIKWWYPSIENKFVEKNRVWSVSWNPKVIEKSEELRIRDNPYYPCDHSVEKYLVVTEESNPSLFLVVRHFAKKDGVGCETTDIKLFKIDLERGEVEYVESIGDQALFLGRYSEPFFISTRDCSGLKSNCVYVAEDLGFYDLEAKCITPFLSLGNLANIRPQVYWVAPPSFV